MAIGGVISPSGSGYLPLTGGTVTGALTVQGGITGDLTGKASRAAKADAADKATNAEHAGKADNATKADSADTAASAENSTKWAGLTLRLNNNTSDTWIPVFSENNMDYMTKDQLLSALTTRVADCEQKIKAIGQTKEVLIRTAVSSTVSYTQVSNGCTIATCESAVAFVTINNRKILRGSNVSFQISSSYDSPGGYSHVLYGIFSFNTDGSITVRRDGPNSYQDSASENGYNFNWNINYYKYAV